MREKLIKLLDQVQHSGLISFPAGFGERQEYVRNDKIADHLSANGVFGPTGEIEFDYTAEDVTNDN